MKQIKEEMELKCKTMAAEKESSESLWVKNRKAVHRVLFTMRLHSVTTNQSKPLSPIESESLTSPAAAASEPSRKIQDIPLTNLVQDKTSLLSDEILIMILAKLPKSQRHANFLVSKRWLNLQGRLVRSIKILSWDFMVSGQLFLRFPNLVNFDLVSGSLVSSLNSSISCTHKIVSCNIGSDISYKDLVFDEKIVMNGDEIDRGLKVLVNGFPNLRKLAVINAGKLGLLSVAEECPTLQELELHMCNDQVLGALAACKNLQILRAIGSVDGLYDSLVSDIGLMLLAEGCRRLVKLELSGCRGSYDGVRAIGQCCSMLEEFVLCNNKMEDGWLSALRHFENLKTLRFLSCKRIDGSYSHLGSCPAVECLQLINCQLRDKGSLTALFLLCQNVTEIVLQNCWGLTDDLFCSASVLRRVRMLHLEGCSILTTRGLEAVIASWDELESLKVKWCKRIKDGEVSPGALCGVFSGLKNLKWEAADAKAAGLFCGAGMGNKGGKFFQGTWKSLPHYSHS